MSSSRVIGIVLWIAAAATGAGAYLSRGAPIVSGLFVLASVSLITYGWVRARRARNSDVLSDPAMSTLVFPPESKFQPSVLPRQ